MRRTQRFAFLLFWVSCNLTRMTGTNSNHDRGLPDPRPQGLLNRTGVGGIWAGEARKGRKFSFLKKIV